MRFTVKSTATIQLPAGKTDFVFFDDDIAGFGLRIRDGGSRTWVYRYRVGKKQYGITLGSATSVPLALARENAGQLEARVRLGGNPASEKQAARAAAGTTVGALVRQYLETKARDWRPNSLREHRRYLLVYARPLHTTPINTVSQHSIAVLPDSVAKKAGDVTSNRLRSSLEAFVGWAIRQGVRLPEGNVVSYTGKRKETSRDRVLSDGDLKAIWTACNDGTDYGACVRLLLLTGQRKEEIGALRFAELRDGHIELPGSRTKNKRPHIVPLSAPAAAILAPFRMVGRTYVFGRNDTAGFRGWAASKRRLDRRLSKNCISPWVLHDLRRTAATRMAELGVQPHIVEAVLNHVSGAKAGVAGIYNRAAYDKEKRAALDLWAEHVLAVAEGRTTTVVPMKRGA